MAPAIPWVSDILVLFGVLLITVGVYGVVRMPDTYLKLHAASKMVVLGVMPLLLAAALTGGGVLLRVIPISLFLLATTPVSAHVVAKAAYLRGEGMVSPGAVDETGRDSGGEG